MFDKAVKCHPNIAQGSVWKVKRKGNGETLVNLGFGDAPSEKIKIAK